MAASVTHQGMDRAEGGGGGGCPEEGPPELRWGEEEQLEER